MIVDTSTLAALVFGEPEAERIEQVLRTASSIRISAGTLLEATIVMDSRLAPARRRQFDDVVVEMGIEVVPVDERQVAIGRAAYQDFGRGSGHPARLNFGDCFAYALARATGDPLLFIGDDFTRTGIRSALVDPSN